MSNFEEVSQEDMQIIKEIREQNQAGTGFESETAQETAYAVAVAGLAAETRAKFAGSAQTESVQADLEALIAVQEGIADTIKNFVLRFIKSNLAKLKALVQQGREAVCNFLKSRVCGALGWPASTACNFAFPSVCRALYGWITKLVGL
jgi:hypothetical protein